MQARIETKLNEAFSPTHCEVINESGGHNVPPGSESHFKVIIASEKFNGLTLLKQHQLVYDTLKGEMTTGGIHALSLYTFTPEQWEQSGQVPDSPPCRGGDSN